MYQFGYEEYQEKLDREAAETEHTYKSNAVFGGVISQNAKKEETSSSGRKPYYNPGKERSKLEKKIRKAEEELAVKEEKLEALRQELLRPEYQSSYSKLTEIQEQIDGMEEQIMEAMEEWEELSSRLETLEQA